MYCRPTCIIGPHVIWAHMYFGPTCTATIHLSNNTCEIYYGLKRMWAHGTCGPTIHVGLLGLLYIWAYFTVGPQNLWAYNTCWTTEHVGLIYMWAHSTSTWGAYYICVQSTCGPTVHVGPQYMWAYHTCRPIVRLGLLYMRAPIHVGLLYVWAYGTCGPIVHVGPQYLLAHNTCGPTIHRGT